MTKLLLIFLFCVVLHMEARTSVASYPPSCPYPHLENGRARVRQRTRSVRFICDLHFELVGSRYATCRGGQWDEPIPICIRSGCNRPSPVNALAISSRDDAWYIFFCYPGQKLVGSPAIYCDGHKWNATAPTCVNENTIPQQLNCSFESRDLCGWRQDELHDFDWRRLNQKTPSSFAFTGPSFDHTLGPDKQGYFMYIESSSRYNNDSARLISPVYDAGLTKSGCFSIFYHMFGKTIGGLRIYQVPDNQRIFNMSDAEKPEYLLFEKWGNQGNFWYRNVSKLKNMTSNFQIVVEGIRGPSFTSDIAIDDVAILPAEQCEEAAATAVTPPELIPETCAGRCDLFGNPSHERGCGCTVSCVTDDNCCSDFFENCVYNSATTADDEDSPIDVPRTEKLIGSTTTTRNPSIAPNTTTKSPRTTEPINIIKTTTTKTTNAPTTTKTTTSKTTKAPTTVKTTKATTLAPKLTTVRLTTKIPTTTKHVALMTTKRQETTQSWAKLEADKARKEKEIEAKKVVKEKPEASSSSAAIVTMIVLVVCLAAAALLALRTARGQAALARLRGRASSDPEVRYLTRDDD